jgi:hypothetical protein
MEKSTAFQTLSMVPDGEYSFTPGGGRSQSVEVQRAGEVIETTFVAESSHFTQTEVTRFQPDGEALMVKCEETRAGVTRTLNADQMIFHPNSTAFNSIMAELLQLGFEQGPLHPLTHESDQIGHA